MDQDVVEPCPSCARHVRASEPICPFCAAPHTPGPRPEPPRAPTRAMLAAWAGIFVAACGGAKPAEAVESNVVPEGQSGGGQSGPNPEVSCAGRCGSHHHPACMDDPVHPCPAPPYGAPPFDEHFV